MLRCVGGSERRDFHSACIVVRGHRGERGNVDRADAEKLSYCKQTYDVFRSLLSSHRNAEFPGVGCRHETRTVGRGVESGVRIVLQVLDMGMPVRHQAYPDVGGQPGPYRRVEPGCVGGSV
jgi:hypothetical protein